MLSKKKYVIPFLLIAGLVSSKLALAEQTPRSLNTDSRIKIIPYNEHDLTALNATLGHQIEVVFDSDETVEHVSNGDSLVWQIVPANNYLFIKPMSLSQTNMTIVTNKHDYNFELTSFATLPSNKQTYRVQFVYPDTRAIALVHIPCKDGESAICNFKYSYTGDKTLVPIQMFDDNKFTYFKFKQQGNHPIPSIFAVDKERNESPVNYHVVGDYVIVNQVGNQFIFRHGNEVLSIYNDNAIGDWASVK